MFPMLSVAGLCSRAGFDLLKYKLGALPQLEWWNAGILEKWVLGYCYIG
jgi:hypothetical protein